jgi:hypothetical protein
VSEVIGYEALTALFDSLGLILGQEDYDLIYVNGDHNVGRCDRCQQAGRRHGR